MVQNKPNKSNKAVELSFGHLSMQFSDSAKQMQHDANKLLDLDYDVITITEAGPNNPLQTIMRREAKAEGYLFHVARETGVIVKRSLIDPDHQYREGYIPVIESYEGVGKHADRGIAWVSFRAKYDLGRISVGCAHYLTKGRSPSQTSGGINFKLNKELARAIQKFGEDAGKGTRLAFYGGDQNIVDRRADTFFGGDFRSSWDEKNRYEDTGHGNIDVQASWDPDGRVKVRSVNSFTDRERHFHTDHLLMETKYLIQPLD